MSKVATNLRKIEKRTFLEWSSAVRYLQETRTAFIKAEYPDSCEKRAIMTMAAANADRAFNTWQQICDALDDVEQLPDRRNGHESRSPTGS